MTTIPAIAAADFDIARFHNSEPCVITGGIAHWPAVRRWSPSYFKEACAELRVPVAVSHSGTFRFGAEGAADNSTQYTLPYVPLPAAVDWIVNRPAGHTYYVAASDMRQYAHLPDDLMFDANVRGASVSLWFGSAGTVTPLHYDVVHNLYAQINGEKTLTLFSPDDLDYLYPNQPFGFYANGCAVDVEAPDYARCPLFREATPRVVHLAAGDMLCIPAFWWHHVRSHSMSMSVSHWRPVPLEDCIGRTAGRFVQREYKRDGLATLRHAQRLTRTALMRAVRTLASRDLSIAIVAAAVALEDYDRYPDRSSRNAVSDRTRRTIAAMLSTVLSQEGRGIDATAAMPAIDELLAIDDVSETSVDGSVVQHAQ